MPDQVRRAAAQRLLEAEREYAEAKAEMQRTGTDEARERYAKALEALKLSEQAAYELTATGQTTVPTRRS